MHKHHNQKSVHDHPGETHPHHDGAKRQGYTDKRHERAGEAKQTRHKEKSKADERKGEMDYGKKKRKK